MDNKCRDSTETPVDYITDFTKKESLSGETSRVKYVEHLLDLLKDFGAEGLKMLSDLSLEEIIPALGFSAAHEMTSGGSMPPSLEAELIVAALIMAKKTYSWWRSEKSMSLDEIKDEIIKSPPPQMFMVTKDNSGHIIKVHKINEDNLSSCRDLIFTAAQDKACSLLVLKSSKDSTPTVEDIELYASLNKACESIGIIFSGYTILYSDGKNIKADNIGSYIRDNNMDTQNNHMELTR